MTAPLTPERLFSDPPLAGSPPQDMRVSPDGRFATMLRIAEDDRERLDLWGVELESGRLELWLQADELPDSGEATAAERAERERKRQFGHGIGSHAWSDDSRQLLVEASGAGYLFDAQQRTFRRATPIGHRYTDTRLSPEGQYLSYVRDGSLFHLHLESGIERKIASSEDAAVSFGSADFVAQEEMNRRDGHWWHPDDLAIAFTKVDVSPVERIQRFAADPLEVAEQRYPFAGSDNPIVELGWYDLESRETRWIEWADADDDYLARAFFKGPEFIVGVQNRAQNQLRFKRVEPDGRVILLFEERSSTWINLNLNFTRIGEADYLWTSEQDGFSHLFRWRQGEQRQLTQGTGHIDKILQADQERALLLGWFEEPTEQHLYRIDLDSGKRPRLTWRGWHEVAVARNGAALIGWHSALGTPGEIWHGKPDAPVDTLADLGIDANHPYHAHRQAHSTPVLGSLEAEDGQTLHYRLTRPDSAAGPMPAGGFPLIVWVYGGPGAQIARNAWPPLNLQLFAQRGFVVLELDNRGSARRGRDFEAPLFRRLGDAEVRDQIVGARRFAGLDWVDGNRIGIFGHSYGGYMTLMCLAKAPELFKAGVCAAPVTDWHYYDTHYTERYLGHPDDNPDGYEASAVFPWLDELRGKLLVMHGPADDNVLFAHTLKLQLALQKRHLPFELMTYPGAKHALQERDVSIHRFDLILDFFQRSL